MDSVEQRTSRRVQPQVHATEPDYQLHSLGWKAFQQLCSTVCSEVWGQTVQGFFDARDGGRDGAFHGTWRPRSGEEFEGSFTVQCKFSSARDKGIRLPSLADELTKARKLAAAGLADNYFLMSSGRLTGVDDAEIRQAILEIPGIKRCAIYGFERISQFIRESPRLRMLVPRVYGLGDLSQILDERAYAQAVEILSALGDDLAKFVITEAYQRAARAIVDHGFVLLLGEPACGKSAIAAALALGALDEWGCSTVKVRDADEFVQHSNPHEAKQFFWIDDAFGATQLDWAGTLKWNSTFPHIHAAIRRGARVIFTSRDYIYRGARSLLKESALPVIHESQVVVQVERLSKEEREQILYNHVRLGGQTAEFKTAVKTYLPIISSHHRFSPEIARRLGSPVFTRDLTISREGLEKFVAHPMALLKEIIQTLDSNSKSAIATVFIRGGSLLSPVDLTTAEEGAIRLLGGAPGELRNALNALNGNLLLSVQQGGAFFWRFKHPTIGDAFGELIAEDRELLDIYLAGTPVFQLMREISCGDVGLEGVEVIVPEDRYGVLIARIKEFQHQRRENQSQVYRFLALRCDKDFLERFIFDTPDFLSRLQVGSYLYAVSDVDVIVRLHDFGLLPEFERRRHVHTIHRLAVDTPDAGFMDARIKALISGDEFQAILNSVQEELIRAIPACISLWADNYSTDDDPEDYFSMLKEALSDYRGAFSNNASATELIEKGLVALNTTIEEFRTQQPSEPDSDDFAADRTDIGRTEDSRSIFDDVDS